jgi:membrane-bound ClpP family serine protease
MVLFGDSKIKTRSRGKRSFILFNLATTAAEETVLMVIMLWLLPSLGMDVPPWIVIVLAMVWAAWSYLTYRIGAKTIEKIPVVGAEALVGVRCITTTPLSPVGYIRAGNELWRAQSIAGDVNIEVEVVVVEVKGLTLLVTPSPEIASGNGHNTSPSPLTKP